MTDLFCWLASEASGFHQSPSIAHRLASGSALKLAQGRCRRGATAYRLTPLRPALRERIYYGRRFGQTFLNGGSTLCDAPRGKATTG
jgi:hypothetical protein